MVVKIVETHSVSPPPSGSGAEQSLPLVYFDMIWLDFILLTESLHFYPIKCSRSHFLNTIVVHLKNSLSLTLQHFHPLSSHIIFPLTPSAMPATAASSLSLTVAISDADFSTLVSNSPKPSAEFHQFVPQPPPPLHSPADIRFSPFAIQLTFFPDDGFCIGLTKHHSICDANTLSRFLRMWAAINRGGGEDSDSDSVKNLLPSYCRDSIQDSDRLTVFRWNQIKKSKPTVSQTLPLPNFNTLVRATFTLSDSQIGNLKSFAMIKNPSTFVVVCAHLWTSMARLDDNNDNDEPYYFGSPIDCRRRLVPPLPDNYFGNCVMPLIAVSTRETLRGNGGFAAAVAALVAAIKVVGRNTRVSEFFENRSEIMSELIGKKAVWVAGSSRIDHYGEDADFGWGEAVKYECIHTDYQGSVHLCKGREGGVEFGLSMDKGKMDIFADVFNKNLYLDSNL